MTDLPATMRTVEVTAPGGASNLGLGERPVPRPGPGEVLIRVEAAGINRPDIFQREGRYPPPPGASDILGLEVAGTIVAVGEGVPAERVGEGVCALLAGGGYAQFVAVPVEQVLPVPRGLSMVEAASLPETFFTVWTNLMERARMAEGETVLVHGGTSGIGTTAIQLVRAFGGQAFATAGSDEKARACEALGAVRGINYRTEDFVALVKELTGGRGVDIVLDIVGGDYIPRNVEAMAVEGRHVSIAFLKGGKVDMNFLPVQVKHLTLTGSRLRHRTPAQKGAIAVQLREKVWPLLENGTIRPSIHATYPIESVAAAHELMESSAHIGKIVLTVTH